MGLSTAFDVGSTGVTDKTNIILRTSKKSSNSELEVYRVNFDGTEAGILASEQSVLKMINFNDNMVAM